MTTINHDDNGQVLFLKTTLIEIVREMALRRHMFQQKYTYEGYYYKETIPIVLAYVMTRH